MAQINLLFPMLPGQSDAHKALLAQIKGEKRAEFDERCRRIGVNWERGFLQQTPGGELFLLAMDADSVEQVLPKLMQPGSDFEKWFMAQAAQIHGLTPEAMKQAPIPPKLVLDWSAPGHVAGKPNLMVAVPVLDVDGWQSFIQDVMGSEKLADFAAERARLGIKRETHFLHQTPMGAFTVIAMEGDPQELAQFGARMIAPVNAFGEWFAQQIGKFNGFSPEAVSHMVFPTMVHDIERSKASVTH